MATEKHKPQKQKQIPYAIKEKLANHRTHKKNLQNSAAQCLSLGSNNNNAHERALFALRALFSYTVVSR